jgi:hypothetical protein
VYVIITSCLLFFCGCGLRLCLGRRYHTLSAVAVDVCEIRTPPPLYAPMTSKCLK